LANNFSRQKKIGLREIKGETEKIYDEELSNLNNSSRILRVVKLRRLRWAGYAAQAKQGICEELGKSLGLLRR
jgi:hypothetical protein